MFGFPHQAQVGVLQGTGGSFQELFLSVKVVTDQAFFQNKGFDLFSIEDPNGSQPKNSNLPTFRVLKTELFGFFKRRVCQYFNVPNDHVWLWILGERLNKAIRPCSVVPAMTSSTVDELRKSVAPRPYNGDLYLYLDILSEPKPYPSSDTVLIFLKHYDMQSLAAYGVEKIHWRQSSKVSSLKSVIKECMGWKQKMSLKLYEEIGPGEVVTLDLKLTLFETGLQHGAVIWFEVIQPELVPVGPVRCLGAGGTSESDDDGLCIACQEEKANMAIIECGHMVLCGGCSKKVLNANRQCPLCRKRIARFLKVYSS